MTLRTSTPPRPRALAPWALAAACALALALAPMSAMRAQSTDYDEIVPPAEQTPEGFDDMLVQRAWLNQGNTRLADAQVAAAALETRLIKRSWLNGLNANINFSSIQDTVFGRFGGGTRPSAANDFQGDDAFLRPGFNYGVAINLGGVLNNKARVRVARANELIAAAKRDQLKLETRAVVATRLENYDNAREILRIRRQSEIDAETNYALVQSLFEQGKAQFEDLAQASEVYHRAVESTAVAESDVRRARYAIEEVTGEDWETMQIVRRSMDAQR